MRTILICLALFFSIKGSAQKIIISGYLTDVDKEAVAGATVRFSEGLISGFTNSYGFFSLSIPSGRACLIFEAAGYQSDTICRPWSRDTTLRIELSGLYLQEVEIVSAPLERDNISSVTMPMALVKRIPGLAGEADPIRALSFTPGVTNGSEGSAGLFVRGGTPDQNLILLDGATVYNPNHLFGFLSVFNPDALKSMELIKGGFPARYGGRLSSVLDISMREGSREKIKGNGGFGLITSKILVEGPWKKDRGSFIVSGRSAYLGLILLPARLGYIGTDVGDYTGYNMFDINAKINYQISDRQQIFLSLYTSRDRLNVWSKSSGEEARTALQWGNITGSLRYNHELGPRLFWKSMLLFSDFDYSFGVRAKSGSSMSDRTRFRQRSQLRDLSLKNEFDFAFNNKHFLRLGMEQTYHRFIPYSTTRAIQTVDTSFENTTRDPMPAFAAAAYIEDTWRIGSRLKANLGGRFNVFSAQGQAYFYLNPRLSLRYAVSKNLSLSASYAEANQNIHLLSSSSLGLQNDIWAPSTANVRPQFGRQWAGGLAYLLGRTGAMLTLEGYHKTMDNQLEYREGVNALINTDPNWENLITANGIGTSYGLELGLSKQSGRLTGLLSYTWSNTTRQFQALNNGNPFPFKYDYRHHLNSAIQYRLSDRWEVALNMVYHTGQAVSVPEAGLAMPPGGMVEDDARLYYYRTRNNARLPDYLRFDLGLSRTRKLDDGRTRTWNFSIYNALNRKNILYAQFANKRVFDRELNKMVNRPTLVLQPFLPILPSVQYSWTF